MKKASAVGRASPASASKRTKAELLREIEALSARLAEVEGTLGEHRAEDDVRALESGLRERTRELTVMNRELLEEIRSRISVEEELRRSESRFRAIYEHAPLGIALIDARGQLVAANPALESMLGVPFARMEGRRIHEFLAPGQEIPRRRIFGELFRGRRPVAEIGIRWAGAGGKESSGRAYISLFRGGPGAPSRFLCVVVDQTRQMRLEAALRENVRRQSTITEIGRLALGRKDSEEVLREAVTLVARQLRATMCGYLELAADHSGFLLRAGEGFVEGIVGRYRPGPGLESHPGYTLRMGEPVPVEDLRAETRFRASPTLLEQGARSGLAVPVAAGSDEPTGVLAVYDVKRRAFGPGEIAFLLSAARIFGMYLQNVRIGEELSRSENRYRVLVEQTPGITYLAAPDETGSPLYVSPQIGALGYDPREWIDDPSLFLSRIHPDDRQLILEEFRRSRENVSPFRSEYRLLARDGRAVWFRDVAVPILGPAGDLLYWQGVMLDVTDRKEAEENVRRSEERFRMLVETLPLGVCLVRDGRVAFQNPGHEELFPGIREGMEFPDSLPVHPEDAGALKEYVAAAGSGSPPAVRAEIRLHPGEASHGRRTRWILFQATPVFRQGVPALLAVSVDITRLKELERSVLVREKLASLGVISASLAHEIRNPLSGMGMYLAALEDLRDRSDEIDPRTRETIGHIAGKIGEASDRISSVIRRIQEFSRPSALRIAPVDIGDAVEEAVRLCAGEIRMRRVELVRPPAAVPVRCRADRQLVTQVLMNLITNALQAMDGADEPRRLEISLGREGESGVVRVSDSGEGIPPHLREQVFDPFFTTRREGQGIGLAFCRRVVEDHRGTLTVGTGRWGGAEFRVAIPLESEDRPA